MNIVFTEDEFDQFIMLYLKDRIESIDNLNITNEDGTTNIFTEFIIELKEKAFWTKLNKVYLDAPMIQKVNTNRITKEKNKEAENNIRILM